MYKCTICVYVCLDDGYFLTLLPLDPLGPGKPLGPEFPCGFTEGKYDEKLIMAT